MRAMQIRKPGLVEAIALDADSSREYHERLVSPPPGWVTVEVAASGICGTDLHIFEGSYLGEYPIIPGHEFSGTITALGADISGFKVGDRVAIEPNLACGICTNCLEQKRHFCEQWQAVGVTMPGGMASHVSVPQQALFSIGDLDFRSGAFMEPLSCVIHGVERVRPELADRVALIGAGPIGVLLLRVLRSAGVARIDVVDTKPARRDFAERSGADAVYDDMAALKREYYDIVVDATGVIAVLERCIEYVRSTGTVLLFGVSPKGASMRVEPFVLFQRELSLVSSFTSLGNSRQAIDMIRSGKVVVEDLVSDMLPLTDLERGFERLRSSTEAVMKVMIDPRSA